MGAKGLRVALFSGNYNYLKEGANQALNRLVGHLLDHGAAVRVYSPTTRTPAFPPTGDLVSVPSVPLPGRSEFRLALGLPRAIRDDVRRFGPNLIHLSTPDFLGFAAQKFGRAMGVPVVASLHTRFETYVEYYGLGRLRDGALDLQRRFYGRCDHVLAPNEANRAHLMALGVAPERISIWGRGVDSTAFSPAARDPAWRRSLGYADDEPVILYFGRVVREKGLGVFADTIVELRRRGWPLRPLVIGDGPARAEFARAIGAAHFTGHLQGPGLGRAAASADILFNPSLTEAFGNVTLEAMAAGLAVVSADVESARPLIVDGVDGLLRPPDATSYADALETLLRDPAFRRALAEQAVISAAGRQWPQILDAVIAAYRRHVPELAE